LKKVGVSTLESNLNNLNLKKFELEDTIQPLSYKNVSNHDVGSAQSLLLNILSISETCEIILDQSAYSMFKGDSKDDLVESITIEKGNFFIFYSFRIICGFQFPSFNNGR
jgi:hypothetical protein